MSGRVVHFEIPFDDGDRARRFYAEAFGWQIEQMPEMSYTLCATGPGDDQGPSEPGFINGGMVAREGSPSTGPIVTLDVESIDRALTRVGELGGAVLVPKQSVGHLGFTAYVSDSEGNVIGLWETIPHG
jgi:predicted enzyme related to lactoylglutathione lyase